MWDVMTSFLASDIRTATPILLAAIGLVFSERAGIVNIGTEGIMLVGALTGVLGSALFGSVYLGALTAIVAGVMVSAVFSYFTITLRADQTVVGAAINIFALGFTTTINRVAFGMGTTAPDISVFTKVTVPLFSNLPILGKAVFSQSIPVYLAFLLVPMTSYVLKKTNLGLHVRAVGEHPRACDTLGISVPQVRYGAVIFSGAMSGLAGAFVSMGQLSFFTENMIAGGGFMALAAVVFGNYTPTGVLFASLLFGAGDALKYKLQAANTDIPSQLLSMLPYLITVAAICAIRRTSNRPAASAVPYVKE